MEKPNILLLTIDTLRRDVLHSYGYSERVTPNIDKLAEEGIRFSQAITGGTWTQAAFPVLLTSSYASMFGGCLGALAKERPSPVSSLADWGYTTAGFSTNPHISVATGYNRGFKYFVDLEPDEKNPPLRYRKGGQRLLRMPITHYISRLLGNGLKPARVYSSARDLVARFSDWLTSNSVSPFFAWLHFMDIHWPYHIEEHLSTPQEIARAWQDLAIMHERSNFNRTRKIDEKQRERFIGLYKQSLKYLDDQLGRLFDLLEVQQNLENTIIILVSDHGEEFLDHGRWGHWESNLFKEIIRIPLIIKIPNMTRGLVINRMVRTLDIMPTILDLCDCPNPPGMFGSSLRPLWEATGQEYDVRFSITEMHRLPWHRISVRTETHKYIWDNKHPEEAELYDLISDPVEKVNIVKDHPELSDQFQIQVDEHLALVAKTEPASPVEGLSYDSNLLERLRDLGYVD